ncbi:hypothetical protein ACWEGE_30435 [Amycolatopsis sp. NPDC004747]
MPLTRPVPFDLTDCRAAHGRVYDIEVHDGTGWQPHGRLVVQDDMVTHDEDHVHAVTYHGANHALLVRGKGGDPTFRARFNLTECGSAFVGTMSTGGGAPQAVRGRVLEQVYHTERHPKADPHAPFRPAEDLTIKSEWVGNDLKITYLLGTEDISDRTRVTKVDRRKGETTLEMVPQLVAPFRQNAFVIVLASGSRTFAGTYTDDDANEYDWRGSSPVPEPVAAARAVVLGNGTAAAADPATATLSVQDLDNISSIEIVTDGKGNQVTVDFAQTTCGGYFNKCLVNGLEDRWVNGIYGHRYTLPEGVKKVFDGSKQFFTENAVLGTGQMLYDNLGTWPQYQDLIRKIRPETMKNVWTDMGKSETEGVRYQEASSALYLEGYRDGVKAMRPYLDHDAEKWAADYFAWLTDDANLLTWQIQVASKQFDNVKTRMYEWYVKLQVLAPKKDYGQRMVTIAYAALLGVNYSKSQWSDDLKPFLQALIENAIAGKVDPTVMDKLQQQTAKENQELLKTLITTTDSILHLVNGIAAALSAYQRKSLQQLATDPEVQHLIGQQLQGKQYEAWNQLSKSGKVKGLLGMLFYGASAGFLIYSIVQDSKNPQTPKAITEEVNLGMLALALLVQGVQKMMSLGVGRFLRNFAGGGRGGAFRAFAGDLATWFAEGGKVIPRGPVGRAFVAVFGENAAEFMARRIGPAMAVCGLVLAAFTLYDAIKSGDVRNIVFEALNTFVALATVALLGLELMSFAWAGPAGLAIAAVGVVIALIQFIWNWIDPPPPPPDPITDFVKGPMVAKGYANA